MHGNLREARACAPRRQGGTPLHRAAGGGHEQAVRWLLDSKGGVHAGAMNLKAG